LLPVQKESALTFEGYIEISFEGFGIGWYPYYPAGQARCLVSAPIFEYQSTDPKLA
jgi:hypothetical protein